MSEALTNLPKLADLIPPDTIAALIEAELAPLRKRAQELEDAAKRFALKYPTIENDEVDGLAAAYLAQCQRFTAKRSGTVDAVRIALKAPVMAAGVAIDAAFPPLASRVEKSSDAVYKASVKYKQKVEQARREAAQKLADERRAQAEATERLASSGAGLISYEDAAAAHEAADKAQAVASAPVADLTRSRGSDFGTSSLKRKRQVTIIAPHEVPRQFCAPVEALLKAAAGKVGDPIPKIPGVLIEDVDDKLTIRR